MHRWAERVAALAADDPVVMLSVVATKGSTPRDVGARMLVSSESIIGSIGGGRLEFDEATHARGLLARHRELGSWHRQVRHIVLGPDAGQCCGGVVNLPEMRTLPNSFRRAFSASLISAGGRSRSASFATIALISSTMVATGSNAFRFVIVSSVPLTAERTN